MTRDPFDVSAKRVREVLGNGKMNLRELSRAMEWSVGKTEHTVNKMILVSLLYCKPGMKDNKITKLLSLTPFEDEIGTPKEFGPLAGRDEMAAKISIQADILYSFVDVSLDDVKEEIDKRFEKYAGIIDIKLNGVMTEILADIKIGSVILNKVLTRMGFTGIGDPKLQKIFTADAKTEE